MTATIVVGGAPPATDAVDPAGSASDGTPWVALLIAGLVGLVIGRRRFGAGRRGPGLLP